MEVVDDPSDKTCLGVIHKGYPDKFGNFWDPPLPVQACPHLVDHPPSLCPCGYKAGII